MAKLPSAADFDRQAPQSGRGIASYQTGQVEAAQFEIGRAIGGISEMFAKETDRLASIQAEEGLNKIKQARLDLQMGEKGFLKLRGGDVVNRPILKEFPEQFKTQIDGIINQLPNPIAKEKLTAASKSEMLGFQSDLLRHSMIESDKHELSVGNSTLEMAKQTAVANWSDTTKITDQYKLGMARIDMDAERTGRDPVEVQQAKSLFAASIHEDVLQAAISNQSLDYAERYFAEHGKEMSINAQAKYRNHLEKEQAERTSQSDADEVWARLGPADANAPVKLFDMERAIREQAKTPEAAKLGVAALRERAQAFNAQQAEANASAINGVYAQIDGGSSMSAIRNSPAWLSLPETKRHEIKKGLEAEAYAREGRDLQRMQRDERALLLRNADAYTAYSDPEALSAMSRDQVRALRPVFGMDGTNHLLNKWEGMQKPGGKLEATIDKEIFNHYAQQIGFNPFDRKKSEVEKERLGELQYRMEALIDVAQTKKRAPLTRTEKEELVKGEMARTVTVDSFWRKAKQVPVIAIDAANIEDVIVPGEDRSKIQSALSIMRQREPNNPAYAPTEANIRRRYLSNISKAGGLINVE